MFEWGIGFDVLVYSMGPGHERAKNIQEFSQVTIARITTFKIMVIRAT